MPAPTKINSYGLETIKGDAWLKAVMADKVLGPSFFLETQGFQRGGSPDGTTKMEHGKRLIGIYYPWIMQHWNDWLEQIMWAWCNYEEIGATGCTGAGKSWGFSIMVWIEWMSNSMNSAGVISSTTKEAIRSRIWTTIKKLRSGLVVNGNYICFNSSHLIDSRTMIQASKGDDKNALTSVAVQGGEVDKALGNIQGRHPKRMIVFVDEGEQTPDAVFSARFNLRAGTDLYRFVSAANAINPHSAYGKFIEPVGGWSSVRDSDEGWPTKTGYCLHFDGLKSPNVLAGRVVVPGLLKQEDVDAIADGPGRDSMEWWMYVRGFPPISGVRNTVLSWAQITSNKADMPTIWQNAFRFKMSLDPAFTTGGDKCILRIARIGRRADGVMTLDLLAPVWIKLDANSTIDPDYQIAAKVKEEAERMNLSPEDFAMDSTAASGLVSIIRQMWKPGFKTINFGSSATDRKMPGEEKTGKDRCLNRVAEMWFAFAALVRSGQIRNLDNAAQSQFCTRQYSLRGERYILESKAEMKSRTKGASPDEADGAVLLADMFRDEAGIESFGEVKASSNEWEKMAKRLQVRESYT